jgi:Tfp pilus assembly protein PilO
MRKLNFNKYIVIFSIGAVVAFVGVFLLLPFEIKKIASVSKEIAKIRGDIQNIEKDWPHKDGYLKYIEKVKTEIQSICEKFVTPQAETSLFSFISSESKNFGIDIKVIKPLALQDYISTKFGKFKYLPISIKAFGRFHNLAKFLNCLQSGKYFFEVTELKIKSNYPSHDIEIIICGLVKE